MIDGKLYSITSTVTGQSYPIQQRLNCKNYGVYVLTCTVDRCKAQYVSSTNLNFTKNISAQRGQFRQGVHSVCVRVGLFFDGFFRRFTY